MKKLLIIIFFFLFLWWLTPWYFCHNFKDPYYFSIHGLQINLDDLIHNDTGLPFSLIRFYHNKITVFAAATFSRYLLFWDIKFVLNLISFTGIFGLACALWYKRYPKILLILMFAFPLIEIFFKPAIIFPVKITLFALPLEIISLLGITKLLSVHNYSKKIYLLLLLILWFSIWWRQIFPLEAFEFCQ